jgi:DNA-binding IclR family transcriptional regulator
MATIRQKGPEQWHAQVRRTGWPPVTETLHTRKDAESWARDVESQMDRGIFVDRSAADQLVTRVVKPVMIKAEFVARAIECRLQSVGDNRKYATVQQPRQTLQDLKLAR